LRNSKSGMIESQVIAMQKAKYGFKENETEINKLSKTLTNEDLISFGTAMQEKGLSKTQLFFHQQQDVFRRRPVEIHAD